MNDFTTDFRVDPDMPAGLEAVTRFQSIKRWHMIDTTRTQSIAEHSANVALLAYYIAVSAPGMYFGAGQTVLAPALLHDLPEVFCGDMPTHTKKYINGIKELEEKLTPAEFRPGMVCSDDQKLLIKLCDLADGMRFIEKYGVDRVAIFAMNGLDAQLQIKLTEARSRWPEEVFNVVNDIITKYLYQ